MTPIVDGCPFFGEANPTEVLLNGRLFKALAAHELGHALVGREPLDVQSALLDRRVRQ